MNLGDVFMAMPVWQEIAQAKFCPRMAYNILGYVKQVSAEYALIEQQRTKLLYEVSGVSPGSAVHLEAGEPGHREFVSRFGEFLQVESKLQPIDLAISGLLDALSGDDSLRISAKQLALLEPFLEECQADNE